MMLYMDYLTPIFFKICYVVLDYMIPFLSVVLFVTSIYNRQIAIKKIIQIFSSRIYRNKND